MIGSKLEILKQNRELGINLEIMGAEMRAGRSMIEALELFADRLGLDEVRDPSSRCCANPLNSAAMLVIYCVFTVTRCETSACFVPKNGEQIVCKNGIAFELFYFPSRPFGCDASRRYQAIDRIEVRGVVHESRLVPRCDLSLRNAKRSRRKKWPQSNEATEFILCR